MKLKLPFTHPLHLVIGFAIWSLWFIGVYAGLSLGCAVAQPPDSYGALTWINGGLLLFTLLTIGLLLFLTLRCWVSLSVIEKCSRQEKFTAWVSAALYLASIFAVLTIGIPILMLPPCL